MGSLLYVYLIAPLRRTARPWRVTGVTRLSPRQWEMTLAPEGHSGLAYRAGQFAWLNVRHSAFSLKENPFSLSSAPSAGPEVSFLIKELGDFTRTIGQIEPGTIAHLDGPYGSLAIDHRPEPGIALIAGGVGLAPLLGILRHLRATGDPRPVKLVYGNRLAEQIVCRADLRPEDVTYVLSEPPAGWDGETGRIDAALIDRVFSAAEFRDWVFVM
jgi:predicted ferric reductase